MCTWVSFVGGAPARPREGPHGPGGLLPPRQGSRAVKGAGGAGEGAERYVEKKQCTHKHR